jgi:catechol 2,3-dioxygenase-like lactoylglutathione lyase family enzyme
MLDHIGLDVSDIKKSKEFYLQALKPLRYEVFME